MSLNRFQEHYLPFPATADDPFTVTGGGDGGHSDPVGTANGVQQAARLGGEGPDLAIVPRWGERRQRAGRVSTPVLPPDCVLLKDK